jgi:hypothetical protein
MAQTETQVIQALLVQVQRVVGQPRIRGRVRMAQMAMPVIQALRAPVQQTVMLALPEMLARRAMLALRVTTVQALLRAMRVRSTPATLETLALLQLRIAQTQQKFGRTKRLA